MTMSLCVTTQVLSFDSGAPSDGTKLDRDTRIGEAIGRAEYKWKSGKNDFQVSLERAFNWLDQRGRLFELTSAGDFEEVPFPNGTGASRKYATKRLGRSAARSARTSTCRSPPAPRLHGSLASTAICRRGSSSGPKEA